MKKILTIPVVLITLFLLTTISSCVKNEFDAPTTTNVDPDLTVSKSIAEIQSMATSTTPILISSNEVIAGIVIADDLSGNFYKEMIIEDSTGAIAVQLDQSNFNTLFPIGRRVFIKCQGLYIADDGDGNFQLGVKDLNTIGRIPSGLVPRYLVGGKWGLSVTPREVTMANLSSVPSQTLVRISGVQFNAADTSLPYANAATQQSVNRVVEDCSGNTIDLYSSGYSTFAGSITPPGKGFISAVYKLYGGSGELLIRNTEDVDMPGGRCGSSSGTTILKTIQQVKDTASSGTITLPDGWTIRGTIISDVASGNITSKNIAIQHGLAGIIVRFTVNNTVLQLNDSVEVEIGGGQLYYYDGLLEVDQVPNARAILRGTGTIVPNAVNISQIAADVNAYQSTLVKLTGVTITGSTTFSGNTVITQGAETIGMFTYPYALFAEDSVPAGTVDLVGLVNVKSSAAEIKMRNASDIQ